MLGCGSAVDVLGCGSAVDVLGCGSVVGVVGSGSLVTLALAIEGGSKLAVNSAGYNFHWSSDDGLNG